MDFSKIIEALEAKGLDSAAASLKALPEESIEGFLSALTVSQTREQKLSDKEVQSEIDRRVTQALAKTKQVATVAEPTTTEGNDLVLQQIKILTDKIAGLELGKVQENKSSSAKAAIQRSKILTEAVQARWLGRINLEEDDYEGQVKNLEQEFTELRQSVADSTPIAGSAPIGKAGNKPSKEEIDAIIKRM